MGKIYLRYIAPQYDFHQDSIRAGETLIVHGKERKQKEPTSLDLMFTLFKYE